LEETHARPALPLDGDDQAFGPNGAWPSALPLPGRFDVFGIGRRRTPTVGFSRRFGFPVGSLDGNADSRVVRGTDAVPTLSSIARNPNRSPNWLRQRLSSPHPPMPNLNLSRSETDDVIAYLQEMARSFRLGSVHVPGDQLLIGEPRSEAAVLSAPVR
jgi:hypothetical protein